MLSTPVLIAIALTGLTCFSCAPLAPADANEVLVASSRDRTFVETTAGPVEGTLTPTTINYLGIPYAEPPIGELRWRPPEPHRPWQTVLDATGFGHRCLQATRYSKLTNASEDCLFLNVYVPRKRPLHDHRVRRLPVMVWIHGGANAGGASDEYDPTPLVEADDSVIVVTLNYRVGPLGFLAHPALDTEGHAAVNYGIMDQQLALKWVRDNIGRFGGDARSVTIFGESAGGLNVATHLVSPLSAGLFDRAIIQSGAYQLDTPSLADSEKLGVAFANRAGCRDQTPACMRALPAKAVLAHAGVVGTPTRAYNQSTVDGQILVKSQREALEAGWINRVPVLQGNASDEGSAFTSRTMTYQEHRKSLTSWAKALGKDPARALAIYSLRHYPTAVEASSAAGGDGVFACGAQVSNRMLSKWVPTYAYEFGDTASGAFGTRHGGEVMYLFNVEFSAPVAQMQAFMYLYKGRFEVVKFDDHGTEMESLRGGPAALSARSRRLSEAMRLAWTAFATSGNPSSRPIPHWPLALDGIEVLEPSLPGALSNSDFSARHHCAFWAPTPRCESLISLKLSDTTITRARSIAPPMTVDAPGGESPIAVSVPFCRVEATLKPTADSDIRMEVWFPAPESWNGKFEGIGNGGLGGSIPIAGMMSGLVRGYAVAATDTGHRDVSGGGAFALGHLEKVIDYGWRATHLTARVGQAIARRYYGRAPIHTYFYGCSQGGAEALIEAQRFPADYDGIIAGDPVVNQTHHEVGAHLWIPLALSVSAGSRIPPGRAALLGRAVNDACDALDGVKDGVLEDPRQCHFDPAVLMCKGAEAPDCFTMPEVEAVRKIWEGPREVLGDGYYPGLERGGEAETWNHWILAGSLEKDYHSVLGLPFFKYFVFGDPDWEPRGFDFKTDPQRIDRKLAATLNASNSNLAPFKGRGGKLIHYHGYSDPDIPPRSSIDYYEAVVRKLGGREKVDSFYRLFMVPGMGHCGGGPGANTFDMLSVLEEWVEHDRAPTRVVATKYRDDDPKKAALRTHPLCPYPQTARYDGTGNTDEAASFECQ